MKVYPRGRWAAERALVGLAISTGIITSCGDEDATAQDQATVEPEPMSEEDEFRANMGQIIDEYEAEYGNVSPCDEMTFRSEDPTPTGLDATTSLMLAVYGNVHGLQFMDREEWHYLETKDLLRDYCDLPF